MLSTFCMYVMNVMKYKSSWLTCCRCLSRTLMDSIVRLPFFVKPLNATPWNTILWRWSQKEIYHLHPKCFAVRVHCLFCLHHAWHVLPCYARHDQILHTLPVALCTICTKYLNRLAWLITVCCRPVQQWCFRWFVCTPERESQKWCIRRYCVRFYGFYAKQQQGYAYSVAMEEACHLLHRKWHARSARAPKVLTWFRPLHAHLWTTHVHA